MIKKIIFINYEEFSNIIRKNYFVDYLISQDIIVEYYDITMIFNNEVHSSNIDFVTIIHSYYELDKKLKKEKVDETLIIPLFSLDGNSINIYRHLNKFKLKTAFFKWGMWPSVNDSIFSKINSKRINYHLLKEIFLNQLSKLFKKIGYIKDYDIVFAAGRIASVQSQNSIVKQVNLSDYNKYLEIREDSQDFTRSNYCVFIDNNASFHPDVVLLGRKHIDSEAYFKEVNDFFEKIENQYGLEVIIAAHPSSNYNRKVFNGREIIKGKTAELVRDSKLVLSSITTSISFPILFNKPIVFFYNNDMVINYSSFGYPDMIIFIAEYLNCLVYNVSEDYKMDIFPSNIPEDIRNKFILDYYISEETKNWSSEILLSQYLKEI